MKRLVALLILMFTPLAFPAGTNEQTGRVVYVKTKDELTNKSFNEHLHFSIIDNGENDYLYVGTNYGMLKNGRIEITKDGKKVIEVEVPYLLYGSTLVPVGDIIKEPTSDRTDFYISNIKGWIK